MLCKPSFIILLDNTAQNIMSMLHKDSTYRISMILANISDL